MHSINRNSYLHNYFADINPRIINRCVDKARGFTVIDVHDLEPPFNRLCSEQPNIPQRDIDVVHRPIGYGRCAMKKLRHEIGSKDESIVIAAIETLAEMMIDPEKAFEAIELKIIDRMVPILSSENPVVRERTAIALWTLAKLTKGREVIVHNKGLLNNMAACLEDTYEEVRLHVAKLIQILAEFWKTADDLIEYGFIAILLNILQQNEEKYIILIHLRTLNALMYSVHGKMICIDHFGFDIFQNFLNEENGDLVGEALNSLTILTSSCVGEKLAREQNILQKVVPLLHDERPEIHTNAVSLIMFCTVKASGKLLAYEHPSMVNRLIHLAKNRLNHRLQLFAIKALTNICEHPKIRKLVNAEYLCEIDKIQVGDDKNLKDYKDILLTVIGWSPDSVKQDVMEECQKNFRHPNFF